MHYDYPAEPLEKIRRVGPPRRAEPGMEECVSMYEDWPVEAARREQRTRRRAEPGMEECVRMYEDWPAEPALVSRQERQTRDVQRGDLKDRTLDPPRR